MKRTLVSASVLAVALSVYADLAAARPGATTPVTVAMTDFKFKLSKKVVSRGTVVFKIVNGGAAPHDFSIQGKKTPIYESGEDGVLRVRFAKAGRYRFVCTVPGHEALGMWGVLRVR